MSNICRTISIPVTAHSTRCIWILAAAVFSSNVLAECPPIAHITAFEGQVSIKPAGKVIKKTPGQTPSPLCAGDEVHTFQGKALLTSENDTVTIDNDSVVTIRSSQAMSVDKGKALFDIQKRGTSTGLVVATRLSVIGVKGTRFLVADKESGVSVALDEGVVDVKSTQGTLQHFREATEAKMNDSFDEFKQEGTDAINKEKNAFETYKNKTQREFVAYVENVTLNAGSELEIGDGVAIERKTGAELESDLQSLRQWKDLR